MKKFILAFIIGSLALSASAATLVTNMAGTNATSIIPTNSLLLRSVTLANSSGATLVATVYDSPDNRVLWTNTALTNVYTYLTNNVRTYTNFSGVVTYQTNTVVWTTNSVQSGWTNTFNALLTVVLSNGATYTYTPSTPLYLSRGLLVTNDKPIGVTVNYSTVLP